MTGTTFLVFLTPISSVIGSTLRGVSIEDFTTNTRFGFSATTYRTNVTRTYFYFMTAMVNTGDSEMYDDSYA